MYIDVSGELNRSIIKTRVMTVKNVVLIVAMPTATVSI